MSEVLSRSLRPRSFDKMFGQAQIVNSIRKQVASGRVPQCWMFTGESGSGKTTIASILALAVQCTHGKKFGAFCKKCQHNAPLHRANIIEIDGAKYRTTKDIESLVETASYSPVPPSLKRVIILDEAHRVSKEAQSILLKPTEKPPKSTIWIICTTEAYAVLKTVRRRFTTFPLQPLKHRLAEEFLDWAAKKADIKRPLDDLKEYINKAGVTSPSIMLDILERYATGVDPDKAAAATPQGVDTMRICKGILSGEWGHCRPEIDKSTPDDVRLIRGALLGFFKTELLKHTPGTRRKLLVEAIESIGNISYGIDEASQLAMLTGRVYTLCEKFNKA
jgi:replication-associated recombination protein RarA